MAKYSLNYKSRKQGNSRNCAILDENCLADTYTVKFDNGLIREVSKSKVYDLDAIDEGLLSKLKEVGTRLWDNIIKAGNFVWTKIGDIILPAVSPINALATAREIDGVGCVLSPNLSRKCNELDIDSAAVVDEQDDDPAFIGNMVDFWHQIMDEYEKMTAYEGLSYSRHPKLYEARDAKEIKMEHKVWDNKSRDEIIELLINQFNDFRHGAGISSKEAPKPYCIWGAPGIGKTQIVNSIINTMRKNDYPASMISINAQVMRKDDFVIPMKKTAYNKIVDATGNEVIVPREIMTDVPKSWLPMYDPNDIYAKDPTTGEMKEVTIEQLDDIANGGDGSGNGEGGFIFVDELSRIAPDVISVLMTLIPERSINGYVLGSKWMFVAAANRPSDMAENADDFQWDAAQTGRFGHLNFVPTFEEWLDWAAHAQIADTSVDSNNPWKIKGLKIDKADAGSRTKSVKDLRKTRLKWAEKKGNLMIPSDIVAFLKEHQNVWYNAAMANDEDPKDIVAKSMYPEARGWENVAKEYNSYEFGRYSAEHPDEVEDDFAKDMYKAYGIRPKRGVGVKDVADIMKHHVGNKVASMWSSWGGFDKLFTKKDAEKVWSLGDKAPVNFASNLDAATIVVMIDKILANHPDYDKAVSDGRRIDMTPDEFVNVIKFLGKCVDSTSSKDSSAKDSLFNAAWANLTLKLIQEPYEIDIKDANSPDFAKYKEGYVLSQKLKQSSKQEIANRK